MVAARRVFCTAIAAAVAAEVAVRALGLTDFPLYEVDSVIGYLPAPRQSGRFLNKNDWAFNDISMGVATPFVPSPGDDLLLVGDSIVFGGNPYRQADRLGPLLQQRSGSTVWPVSAGSWGIVNQAAYLARHPEAVRGVDRIVFVWNGGDFGVGSSWVCDRNHPREKPLVAVPYLMDRYVVRWRDCRETPPHLRLAPKPWLPMLRSALEGARDKPVAVFLFPDRNNTLLKDFERLETLGREVVALNHPHLTIHSIGRDPRWNVGLYRDDIHPTPEGNGVLADIIARPGRTQWP